MPKSIQSKLKKVKFKFKYKAKLRTQQLKQSKTLSFIK